MKKTIFLLSLVCILIFIGYNPTGTAMVHAQKTLKPDTEAISKNTPVNYYSVEEVKERLSNPSSHYKNSNKFPDIWAACGLLTEKGHLFSHFK